MGGGHTERGVCVAVAQEENERPSVVLEVLAAPKVECIIPMEPVEIWEIGCKNQLNQPRGSNGWWVTSEDP